MGAFWAFSWILIPLAAILLGGFKEWLKFKEKQLKLGESTEHLDARVKELAQALELSEVHNDRLLNRIQNIETIVISQVWDVLHDDEKPAEIKKLEIESVKPLIKLPPREEDAAEKAEKLARRLKI